MEESQTTSARSEVIKFLLLVGVCVVVVLVVALSRPLIFKRIVPAVLGEGQPVPAAVPDTAVDESRNEPVDAEEADAAADEEEAEAPVDETESTADSVEEEASSEEDAVVEEVEAEDEGETAVSEETTHTVQAGDTLYSIARKYSVTVEDIAEANQLVDVNRVVLGQTLIIPQP